MDICTSERNTGSTGHSFLNGICTICGAISTDFFGANEEVTRGKMCYLLWAMNGCPDPGDTTHNYVDISEDDYYYTAVLWALESGITTGVNTTQFGSDNPCPRAVVVTFLWRAADWPEPASADNTFSDVKESDYFYKAVLWADEQNLQIANVCDNRFNPFAISTFGQILGDNHILGTHSFYYPSYFNSCQHFVELWMQVYVENLGETVGTVGHFYNILEWISDEEAERLQRENGM